MREASSSESAAAYERLEGRIYFAFEPDHPSNARIADLALAPTGDGGRVEAWSELIVLQPVDPERRRGVALVDVVNRGRRLSMATFNGARMAFPGLPSSGPAPPAWGDRFLMREGLTLIWIGWQHDAPESPGSLRLRVPAARASGDQPIRGPVRVDWVVDAAAETLPLGALGHAAYPAADLSDPEASLTWREGRDAPRQPVPRERWAFALTADGERRPDPYHVSLRGGFVPGRIYELVYAAVDPPVAGLGLAALRDVVAYAKHDPDCPFPVRLGLAHGASQSGRFLRQLLFEGLNTDERGRPAYDGLFVSLAGGGRGSFNHRFAQPGRVTTRYGSFLYPIDLFPFSTRAQTEPESGRRAGLTDALAPGHVPKIVQLNTGYEYWSRAASLIHTSPDGVADVEPSPRERLYLLASAPHFALPFPPREEMRMGENAYRGSPLASQSVGRALLRALIAWVETDAEPPASRVPRIDRGSLVPIDRVAYPGLPGVRRARVAHTPRRTDYGPRWAQGIVDLEPPGVGRPFPALVSDVDELGNEVSGIRTVELRAPLATYLPWNLRLGYPAQTDELVDFHGTFVPLPISAEQAAERGDSRPSVAALYPSRDAYRARVEAAADDLIAEGFLLPEDRATELARAAARWEWAHAR